MTYIETLNWIHSHKANGRRPSLERMRYLLNLLDNPQDKFPAVHVVGTNGKGSTTSFLQHILTASSYKTGTFTSPLLRALMSVSLSMAKKFLIAIWLKQHRQLNLS